MQQGPSDKELYKLWESVIKNFDIDSARALFKHKISPVLSDGNNIVREIASIYENKEILAMLEKF